MIIWPNEPDSTVIALVTRYVRAPSQAWRDATGLRLAFDPPLTAEEQVVHDRLLALARSAVQVTPDEWDALLPILVSLRDHRTRSNADWSAMTAAQRDTALIDWCRNLTDVLRALLRD